MSYINNQNTNSGQYLLNPYLRITIGSKGSTEAETFTIGDGKLIKASVTLGEGKAQSSCNFTIYDPKKTLVDKFFTYVESAGGLDPVEASKSVSSTPSVTSITNSAIPDANSGVGVIGKVLFEKTTASIFNDTTGSRDNILYPDRAFGCAMRYNNPAAARQFGSQGMFTDLKFGDKVKVTNLDNGKSVICDIQDWGPHTTLGNRGIDLFTRAFNELTGTKGFQAANAIGLLHNIKVELVENSTTTSASSTSNQTKEQTATQQSNQAKTSQLSSIKVNDWPTALLPATKSIIVVPGHVADGASGSGTNGTATSSVTYKGESRTLEFVVNDKLTEMLLTKLPQAGYTVVTAPTVPAGRSDATRRAYQDAIKTLKEQTGAYAFEIHCDEPAGRSGVIPGGKYDLSGKSLSTIDVSLANEFGSYSFTHRQALSAPSRGITLLEVTNLGAALTSITQSAVSSGNYQTLNDTLLPIALKIIKAFDSATSGVTPTSNVASSVAASQSPATQVTPIAKTLAGAQITVEMGYGGKAIAAYSFIHTGLKFSLFEPDALEFSGTAATWVLTQRVRNTVYTNLTFKKIAQKITSNYGMKLEMPEDGPLYTRFPQRGLTDYEALLIEARRIGYRVHCVGPTLYIGPRKGLKADQNVFICEYGTNMGGVFTVSHQAQTSSSGGARSSKPGETTSTGERKFEIDPDSGAMVQKKKENVVGTGGDNLPSTTGAISPIPAPTTTGATDTADSQRVNNESRIKGILAQTEFPTTPEVLTLDPDTLFQTKGVSKFLDRMWVVDSITHTYSGGSFVSRATCYSPLKNKSTSSDIPSVKSITNSIVDTTTENVAKAEATGSPYLLVVRTGKKDEVGLELLNVLLIDAQGNVKGSVNASSGNGSNQTFAGPGGTTTGSGDPCEEGLYNLGSEVPGASAGVGAIFIPMNPTFSTTRSAIGFHLDANRSTSPGSAGCIAPHTLAEFSKARGWIKDNNITTIRCYWGISPTFGNTISKETKPTSNTATNSTTATLKNQTLYDAAIACRGLDTTAGPGQGNVACVWAVNRVLEKANIANPWGNSDAVAVVQSSLDSGKGVRINSSEASPGDIAIWNGSNGQHIGIVLGDKIISNSSTKRKFIWESPASFYENFYKVKTIYYRLR